MPVLKNAKHELFAQGVASGKSATQAYADAGYKSSRENASRLLTNDNVQSRVGELQSCVAQHVMETSASLADKLEVVAIAALKAQQYGASVAAYMGKGKILGLVKERREHTGRDGGKIEVSNKSQIINEIMMLVAPEAKKNSV